MTVSTILFDLDGTLLEMKTDPFVKDYLKEVGRHIGDQYDTQKMLTMIWEATKAMIVNQEPEKTNEQVFIEIFHDTQRMEA